MGALIAQPVNGPENGDKNNKSDEIYSKVKNWFGPFMSKTLESQRFFVSRSGSLLIVD